SASSAPISRNANGSASSPVMAKARVMTPATTVRGVAADITKNTTAGTPSRSAARAVDTEPGRAGAAPVAGEDDMEGSSFMNGRSGTAGDHRVTDRGVHVPHQRVHCGGQVRDQVPQVLLGGGVRGVEPGTVWSGRYAPAGTRHP